MEKATKEQIEQLEALRAVRAAAQAAHRENRCAETLAASVAANAEVEALFTSADFPKTRLRNGRAPASKAGVRQRQERLAR